MTTDRYRDQTRATLFDAWYQTCTPHVQARLTRWLFVFANYFISERFEPENALTMAQSSIWQFANKDMQQVMAILEQRATERITT